MSDIQKIPFSPPDITQEEIDEVVDTLRSGCERTAWSLWNYFPSYYNG